MFEVGDEDVTLVRSAADAVSRQAVECKAAQIILIELQYAPLEPKEE